MSSLNIGNEYWKLRSRHGRKKLFESPESLWDSACEYFQWCVDNPLQRVEVKVVSRGGNLGSKVVLVNVPQLRPFTLNGLCRFLNCSCSYFRQFKSAKRLQKEDFVTVIQNIEEVIYDQKFVGAAVGIFNANIISRDLGLRYKGSATMSNVEISPKNIFKLRDGTEIEY